LALSVAVAAQAAVVSTKQSKQLRAGAAPPAAATRDVEVVKPLKFKQDLLVCNAYPGESTVSVKQNGQEPADDQQNIRFKECRHLAETVHSKDKLDFIFSGSGIQGSFEIGELPETDAMLLLVIERRDAGSPLASFQSFAFPSRVDGKDAQLAVIDAYKGNSSSPHLRMEDHVTDKEKKTVSKRVEQLNFNRIYAVEEGTYDASIADHAVNGVAAKTLMHLSKNQNYVVLRTGMKAEQSLVVYPPLEQFKSSAKSALEVSFFLFAALCAQLFF